MKVAMMIKLWYVPVAILAVATTNTILADNQPAHLNCTGPNEVASPTTPLCPVDCQNHREKRCYGLMLKPSCQCRTGTLRDTTSGHCVPQENCPGEEQGYHFSNECNYEFEFYRDTTPVCPELCTYGYVEPSRCDVVIHQPSCQCRHRYIRDMETGHCIERSRCHFRFVPFHYDQLNYHHDHGSKMVDEAYELSTAADEAATFDY